MEDTFNGHADILIPSIHRTYLSPSGKNKPSIKLEEARYVETWQKTLHSSCTMLSRRLLFLPSSSLSLTKTHSLQRSLSWSQAYQQSKQNERIHRAQCSIGLITPDRRIQTSFRDVSWIFFRTTKHLSVAFSFSRHDDRCRRWARCWTWLRVTRPPCIERRIPAELAVASSTTRTSEPTASYYSDSTSLGWLML